METRSAKRRKISDSLPIVQNSRLLNLPAELRTEIYELVAADIATICISHVRLYYKCPLSVTCRQIREEYHSVFKDQTLKYAGNIDFYMLDFMWEMDIVSIVSIVRATNNLPPSAPGIDRKSALVITLTNDWDVQERRLSKLWNASLKYGFRVPAVKFRWDVSTFDLDQGRRRMGHLRLDDPPGRDDNNVHDGRVHTRKRAFHRHLRAQFGVQGYEMRIRRP